MTEGGEGKEELKVDGYGSASSAVIGYIWYLNEASIFISYENHVASGRNDLIWREEAPAHGPLSIQIIAHIHLSIIYTSRTLISLLKLALLLNGVTLASR